MKILVIGAGVLGSLYAARLQAAGHDVSIMARGERLEQIRARGILLQEHGSKMVSATPVRAIDLLDPHESFDWVLVLVRGNQVAELLPTLAASRGTPNLLFMTNNAAGPGELKAALGRGRVVLGFPGAGGERVGDVVRFLIAGQRGQPTTLGELDGLISPRLLQIGRVLRDAGFPVAFSPDMDAWLKTHAALVVPIACALYLAGGDNYRLARTRDGLVLMLRAMREGLRVLDRLGFEVEPSRYRWLARIPEPLLVAVFKQAMATRRAELVLARHANAARDEMSFLTDEFMRLARASGLSTPALDWLTQYVDPAVPTVPQGRRDLVLEWRQAAAWLLALIWGYAYLRVTLRRLNQRRSV